LNIRSFGFTLVELVVVIAIIAVLTSLTLPTYIAYLDRSAFGACQQELRTFKTQVLATDNLSEVLRPFSFAACGVGGEGQPDQAAVASAFRGVFANEDGGEATSLLLDTQRTGVQAQITANGQIERFVVP